MEPEPELEPAAAPAPAPESVVVAREVAEHVAIVSKLSSPLALWNTAEAGDVVEVGRLPTDGADVNEEGDYSAIAQRAETLVHSL
jgi:hypothetical protein